MGCWNATCFMSNLPIMVGDKIALFVLGPTSVTEKSGDACHPDDYYVHLGFPIIGTYDDYGGIKNVENNPFMERYLREFTPVYMKSEDAETQYVQYNSWVVLDDFLRNLTERNLYVSSIRGEKQKLEFVMMHYDLYLRLLENVGNRIPYSRSTTYASLMEHRTRKVLDWLENERMLLAKVHVEIGDAHPPIYRFHDGMNFGSDFRWKSMNKFAEYYLDTRDETIIQGMRDHIVWTKVMSLSRKGYHCFSGAGSQDQELMIHKIIAEYVLEKCSEREMEVQEDGGEGNALEQTLHFWEN